MQKKEYCKIYIILLYKFILYYDYAVSLTTLSVQLHIYATCSKLYGKCVHPKRSGPSPAGGAVVPGPQFEIGAPPFHVWPTGCCIHPILYFKN